MKDVTQAIKEARENGNVLLSVELDIGQQHHSKPVALSTGDMPYLLLYANDQALAEPNSVAASLQRYDPFGEGAEASQSSQLLHLPNSPSESRARKRKEATPLSEPIQNNELPEVDYMPEGYRKDDLWESTWYLALKPKPKSGRKEKKRKSQEEETVEETTEPQVSKGERTSEGPRPDEPAVKKLKLSHTASSGRKHERRNEDKDGKKHKGNPNAQSPVLNFDEHTMRKARRRQWGNAQHRGCSRRGLRVDFADIGWSEWIIAPKAFDAYYCGGTCGFPMPKVGAQTSKSLNPSGFVRHIQWMNYGLFLAGCEAI